MRSTTSYYQVAVNLPATYYGNVTVSLTVRAHTSSVPATLIVKQSNDQQSAKSGQSLTELRASHVAADHGARTTSFYWHLGCKALLLSRPTQTCECRSGLDKANATSQGQCDLQTAGTAAHADDEVRRRRVGQLQGRCWAVRTSDCAAQFPARDRPAAQGHGLSDPPAAGPQGRDRLGKAISFTRGKRMS